LDAIDLELQLRDARGEGCENARELGALPSRVEEPVGDRRHGFDPFALAVLDHEVEAAGRAQPLDGRGLEDRHPRIADLLRQLALELPRQAHGPQLWRGPVGPFLEHDERGSGIRLIDGGDGVVAVQDQDIAYTMELTGDLANALSDPAGRLPGGAVRRLQGD